ncbi:MAG TPA: hypothetical protein VM029_15920, partial [Opitutaceae bacterium]|nr:hypothetical protein [Opitutaceae bacterium]
MLPLIVRRLVPCLIFPLAAAAQLPVFDPSFAPNPNGSLNAAVVQPDGKLVIIGSFSQVAGAARTNIARLNADGSVDLTFTPSVSASLQGLALAPDGKILVGGFFSTFNGQPRNRLVRLNADGTTDSTFNPSITGNAVRAFLVLPDGRIVIGGDFTNVSGQSRTGLARLNADGTLDASFVGDTSGSTTPTASAGVFVLARQLDGRLLVGGQFASVNGQSRRALARLSAEGVLDAAFDPVGSGSPSIQALTVQRDGRFLVGGSFSAMSGQSRTYLARFLPDGSLDGSFSPSIGSTVFAASEQSDGKILIGGLFTSLFGSPRSYFARLNANGTVDSAFTHDAAGTTISTGPGVQFIIESADGRIVFGGSFTSASGIARSNLARLTAAAPGFPSAATAATATAGQPYTLSVVITGTPSTYQWRRNGVAIPGATASTYTIAQVQTSDAGVYDLVATNSLGSATSAPITLGVAFPPQIVTAPTSAIAIAGSSSAAFSVTATGTPTL